MNVLAHNGFHPRTQGPECASTWHECRILSVNNHYFRGFSRIESTITVEPCPEFHSNRQATTCSKHSPLEEPAATASGRAAAGTTRAHTAAGCCVIDVRRLLHQSSNASSRNGGAPMRPPAGPSVGFGTDTVCVTALYTALG